MSAIPVHPGYRPEIDGLRAIAVVPVVLFHGGFTGFEGGFVGVDVFFVISGYLITRILLSDLAQGRFSIVRFWERRARRILPALYFVILCCLPLAWMLMVPSQLMDLGGMLFSVVIFAANIHLWRTTDYFSPAAEENPLLHTWSLAVEEQFYLLFPLLLWLVWRVWRGERKNILFVMFLLVLSSLAFAHWMHDRHPVANFFLLPSRAWELGVGAICALWLHSRVQPRSGWAAMLGLGLILLAVVIFDDSTPFPSLYALLPVLGTALVILTADSRAWIGRVLGSRWFVGTGLVSYSAYLWHQPLFAFARIQSVTSEPSLPVMATLALVTFGLAALTWRYVEQPFRRPGHAGGVSPRAVVAGASVMALALVAVAFALLTTGGLRDQWIARHANLATELALIESVESRRRGRLDDRHCRFGVRSPSDGVLARIRACRQEHGPGVLILGDSHSIDLFNGVVTVDAEPGKFVVGLNDSSCRLHGADNACFSRLLLLLQEDVGVFKRVYYTQAGFHLLETDVGRRGRGIISGVPMDSPVDPADYRVIRDALNQVVVRLDALSPYAQVVWIGPRIEPHLSAALILRRGCAAEYRLRPGQEAIYRMLDTGAQATMSEYGLAYVSQIDAVGLDMTRDFISCERWLWRDGDHWSFEGSAYFVARLVAHGIFDHDTDMSRGAADREP